MAGKNDEKQKSMTMKASIKYIFYIIAMIALLESCEDNRLDNMDSDKIYLVKSGLQQATVYNFGTCDYGVSVYKSGYGTEEANLEFTITPALLAEYNLTNGTNYLELPSNCYSVESNQITVSPKTLSANFDIAFNTTEILKLQDAGAGYVLPLQMKALNNIELVDSKSNVLLMPNVAEPYISFALPGLSPSSLSISTSDPNEFDIYTQLKTNYKNLWDLSFLIESNPQALADYNQAHNTSYLLLPESAYQLKSEAWSLPSGTSLKDLPINLMRDKLVSDNGVYLFGEYVLPMKISSVSKYEVDPDGATQLFRISYLPEQLSRDGWEVIDFNSCISQESWYTWLNRTPDKMLDDDVTTFWGSKWDTPKPLPYYFVIDMKTTKNIFRVGVTKPNDSWRGNMKKGYFEISDDQNQWKKLADWESASNAPRSYVIDVVPQKGRYLRLVITEAFDYADNSIGAESGARMDISELYVWGINE